MKQQNSIQLNGTPFSKGYYLTDGGLETSLIFNQKINLPHFAAFGLLTHGKGRSALSDYYHPYLKIAKQYGLNFIQETPTWRASYDWGYKLGYSPQEIDQINRKAVEMMHALRALINWSAQVIISGCIGPRGDGYNINQSMTAIEAKDYHRPQIRVFGQAGADLVTALTINYIEEGIGIVKAAKEATIPVVLSYTVETNGRLPSGERLAEAITTTDRISGGYVTHYMINCAHPSQFTHVLNQDQGWINRIGGIRANASKKSHQELDQSETLDIGDVDCLALNYGELKDMLPNLKVLGGCCGTDHSHMEAICQHFFSDLKVNNKMIKD